MDWVAVTAIIAAGGMLLTVGGVVFAFGQSAAQLKTLEERVKEDREKNSEQHKDFYDTRETVSSIATRFDSIEKRLDKLEDGLMQILQRLPERRRDEGK